VADRIFFDTNLFVYSITDDDPIKSQIATALIRRAVNAHKGCVSYQVIQEFCNTALRRFEYSMSTAECGEYIENVLRPMLRVHSSMELFQETLAFKKRYQLSWYDSLIVCAALQAECGILYSEDMQHGQRFGNLQIQNPFL
jgi:predicted nucleic acid-binding protein